MTKTTVGIASSLEFACASKKCYESKKKSLARLEAETIGENDEVLGRGCRDVRSVTKYSRIRLSRIQDGLKKQMADKATEITYASGMNMADDCAEEGGGKRQKVTATGCRFCGSLTHKTRRSANYLYRGWEEEDVKAGMVRLSISKATGVAVGVQSEGKSEPFGSGCNTTNMHYCQC